MGWWSATILGGDSPLDELGNMEDIANLRDYEGDAEYSSAERKAAIEKAMPKLLKYVESEGDQIAYQVLGVLIITCGAKLPDQLRGQIINACRSDEWYLDGDKERKFFINKFIRQLQRYPVGGGRPRQIAYEGLFDAMFKKKGGGLVNKNV